MSCWFPSSTTYGGSGFPGTPEKFTTSYPLSAATGGPIGPSAGPSVTGTCCANGQNAGPCSALGKVCQSGGQIGDCVATSQCTGTVCCQNGVSIGSCNNPGKVCKGKMGPHPALGNCVAARSCGNSTSLLGSHKSKEQQKWWLSPVAIGAALVLLLLFYFLWKRQA